LRGCARAGVVGRLAVTVAFLHACAQDMPLFRRRMALDIQRVRTE
jgi:hypothetical protein